MLELTIDRILNGLLGLLPALIWLFYYLAKDTHPEPRKMILRIFLWGAVIAAPVALIEIGLREILEKLNFDYYTYNFLMFFFIVAPVEEFFKYLVVKVKVINNPNLDEPIDLMIYMVVSALGFAGLENMLYMMTSSDTINGAIELNIIRFLGAIFIHTLSSAIIGYCLAISFCEVKRKQIILVGGILLAIILHATFNFVMMIVEEPLSYYLATFLIVTSAFLVFAGFEKLKKMKSICKIR